MSLQLSDFKDSGLYLVFEDGHSLPLTLERIVERSRAILADPSKVPPEVKQAAEFQLCSVCPKRETGDTCQAILPILAVWDSVDVNGSHEHVTAVYRDSRSDLIIATETTLQRALQYVSLLSLLYYCEVGHQYWRYFDGVHPLMKTEDVVVRVYLNIFAACDGDLKRTRAIIARFHDEITVTTQCQMARLRLVCHSDALLNALILTQIASQFLTDHVEELVRRHATEFEGTFF